VQLVVAHQPHAIKAQPRLAERPLERPDQRVPVESDHALAFAAADQHLEALHWHIDLQGLDPFDSDAQRVVAPQVLELGAIFAFDRKDSLASMNTTRFTISCWRAP
jgi:Holliday junction resolvasome RuvABC ATP-dependent DNA helicase subunit